MVTEVEGDVYVCNQTGFIDWIILMQKYSPVFTKIVVVEKKSGEKKAGLRIMGTFEAVRNALGLVFPEVVDEDKPYIYYSVKQLREEAGFLHYKGKRPVVIFPEGTKTNGCGILNIEPGIVKMIEKACHYDENLRVHAIRFDHTYKFFSPYNSTDDVGFWHLINCAS